MLQRLEDMVATCNHLGIAGGGGWRIILHCCRLVTGDAGLGVKRYRCPEVLFQSGAS